MEEKFLNILRESFRGDFYFTEKDLEKYARDASLFFVLPKGIFAPKDSEDIKTLVLNVKKANKEGGNFSLTARSGGTDMTGGPLTDSLVVDMTKYMNKIKEVGNDYAIVQPGVFYRDFDKETRKKNLFLPSYPASREICTVGGMVANNSGGEKTLRYGKTEDYLLAVKMICMDGEEYTFSSLSLPELERKKSLNTLEGQIYREIYSLIDENKDFIQEKKPRVSKNSSGYYLWNVSNKEKKTFNLAKLIVGSQGTLGIITEIKFRLVNPENHSRMLVIFLNDLKILPEVTSRVLSKTPESFESYDKHTFSVALRFVPELIKHMSGNLFTLGLKFLPEFWMAIKGGLPEMVLMAEFTAKTGEEAYQLAEEAREKLADLNLESKTTKSAWEASKYWAMRRESFNLLRKHIKGLRTAPFIDDIIISPDKLGEFLPKLYGILEKQELTYTVAGHVGDGNFHIIPLMRTSDSNAKDIISKLMGEVTNLVFSFGGSMSAEHNDGLIRTPFLKEMFGEKMYNIFAGTKKIFDPENIFNPHKKVDSRTIMENLEFLDKNAKN